MAIMAPVVPAPLSAIAKKFNRPPEKMGGFFLPVGQAPVAVAMWHFATQPFVNLMVPVKARQSHV